MKTKLSNSNEDLSIACCGGPASKGESACCVSDAKAKSEGKKGCGCNLESSESNTCCGLESQTKSGLDQLTHEEITEAVRNQYTKVAENNGYGCGIAESSCCGSTVEEFNSIAQDLGYSYKETNSVPASANMGLGCGNPQAIASLKQGETVLDLGSGGGFDCFLAARQVGSAGRVLGVDMTPAMINKARTIATKGNYENVQFFLGQIESLPITNGTIDVIISNCVINLSPNKNLVFSEAFRVLKSGGRLAIADIVAFAEPPAEIRKNMELYTGCMAGASTIKEMETMLQNAGFQNIRISPKNESKGFIRNWAPNIPITEFIISAYIEATKPKG